MITHLEPDILECEVKWALGSKTNKARGSDGIAVDLFQILKDDAVKMLHLICQQIWKTQQWPPDWKRSVFTPVPKNSKRDKKAFFSDQCKEIEANNRMGKTRDLFKKIRDTKGIFMQRWAR